MPALGLPRPLPVADSAAGPRWHPAGTRQQLLPARSRVEVLDHARAVARGDGSLFPRRFKPDTVTVVAVRRQLSWRLHRHVGQLIEGPDQPEELRALLGRDRPDGRQTATF